MGRWFGFAVAAALLYGLHQVFTKLAARRIGDGVGSLVVEASAAATILIYLGYLRFAGQWNQAVSTSGILWSILTGLCVGAGTVIFFLLFQHGGPLVAVPAILAAGAALMAVVGFVFFREPVSLPRIAGVVLSVAGLYLLSK